MQGRNTPEAKLTRSEAPLVATVGALVTFVRKISGIYDDFVTMIKRGQSPVCTCYCDPPPPRALPHPASLG